MADTRTWSYAKYFQYIDTEIVCQTVAILAWTTEGAWVYIQLASSTLDAQRNFLSNEDVTNEIL